MNPFFEPIHGEVPPFVDTAFLVSLHGPAVARLMSGSYQAIEMLDGSVFESSRWVDGTWLPWSHRPCHSFDRLARHMGATVERSEP